MEFVNKIASLRPTRNFVPADLTFRDIEGIEKLFTDLVNQPINDVAALKAWLRDRDELSAVVYEQVSVTQIVHSCNVLDKQKEDDYLFCVQKLSPLLMKYGQLLNKKYFDCSHRADLDRDYYATYDKEIENEIAIYRDENIPLTTQERSTVNEYGKLTGGLMIPFRGEDHTPSAVHKFMLEPDRATRQEAYEATAGAYEPHAATFDDIYDRLRALRRTIGANAGFQNYTDYVFRLRSRFDYTPQTCFDFHAAVEKHAVPVLARLHRERTQKLGVDRLRPWDLSVDALGRPPLKPFATTADMVATLQHYYHEAHPTIAAVFDRMVETRTLDLDSRKGKRPGGYMSYLPESNIPFIFMNVVGTHDNLVTMLHETGHAVHGFQSSARHKLLAYRHAPIEMAEVASMTMELIGLDGLKHFYRDADDIQRAKQEQFERAVALIVGVARGDLFQHWIYAHPDHSAAERSQKWLELASRFMPEVDYSGYEDVTAHGWQRVLHYFHYPFYYIEYGMSEIGALQIWKRYRDEPSAALEKYIEGLALGGSRSTPELYQAVGARFDFGDDVLRDVMDFVTRTLDTF